MKLVVLIFALLCLWLRLAMGASVSLQWDASPSPGVTNYQLRYGQTSKIYTVAVSFAGTNLNGTVSNLTFGRWYFVVTARATNGLESDFSNEVSWTNTAFAPVNLRITGPTDALILQSAISASGPWSTLAVITSSNTALQLKQQPKQLFRAYSTNLPPLPGGSP